MKDEKLVMMNYNQKIGMWMAGSREEKLKEHIRMLDWVLSGEIAPVRSIEAIIKKPVTN